MQTWISCHFYPEETLDVFLVRAVRPFLEQHVWPQKGTRAFFIRYDDERGRHIRLRVRGEAGWLEGTLLPALEAHFAGRGERRDVPYEPEPERFGGPEALAWAEEHFHISTRVVLDRLARQPYTYGDALFDALRLNAIMAYAAGFDRERSAWYFSRLADQWLPLFFEPAGGDPDRPEAFATVRDHFETNFERQREDLRVAIDELWIALYRGRFDTAQPEWVRWLRGNEMILKEFGENLERALPSLIHLSNNRLGIGNQDEVFVNFLLSRTI